MSIARKTFKSLHIPAVHDRFRTKIFPLYIQDNDKQFDSLDVPRLLAVTILGDSNNFQGHAESNKIYVYSKQDFYWNGMWKDIDKFVQNCHICKKQNLQMYTILLLIYYTTPQRQFVTIVCDLSGVLDPPSSNENIYALTCICLLMNFPIALPIPDRSVNTITGTYLQHIHAVFWRFP